MTQTKISPDLRGVRVAAMHLRGTERAKLGGGHAASHAPLVLAHPPLGSAERRAENSRHPLPHAMLGLPRDTILSLRSRKCYNRAYSTIELGTVRIP